MATTKTPVKAFINLGKVTKKNVAGKSETHDEYIVVSEDLAKYVGAVYTTQTPPARQVTVSKGKLKGRTYTVEHSAKISGVKYELGYNDGTITQNGKTKPKVKWIPLHIPRGMTLRTLLKALSTKFKKTPRFLKSPDGIISHFEK